jgi:Protein of unknown function (DUF1194)
MKWICLMPLLAIGALLYGPAGADDIAGYDLRSSVDADIITAVDDSSSMTRLKRMVEYTGLAKAVVDPDFLARIASGPNGRVGFTAFSWSSDGKIEVIVPWMLITTADDAAKASAMFLKAIEIDASQQFVVRWTDVALAIDAADAISQASPFARSHTFINICSDGVSNSGAAPRAARDRALTEDVTINAVLFGNRPMLVDYYARNVIGGSGAFILPISDAAAMSTLLARKYWLDLTS